MEPIKINQSFKYCDRQVEWIDKNITSKRTRQEEKKRLEERFFQTFNIRRSWQALRQQAKKLGLTPTRNKYKVGVSRRRHRRGDWDRVLTSLNPETWDSLNRYVWETHTGKKLDRKEIIIGLNGVVDNPTFDELRKVSRSELLRMNKLDQRIPVETRLLIAKLHSNIDNLEGRGDWSEIEIKWLITNGRNDGGKYFWVDLTVKFNITFNKSRDNRDLIAKYYAVRRSLNVR